MQRDTRLKELSCQKNKIKYNHLSQRKKNRNLLVNQDSFFPKVIQRVFYVSLQYFICTDFHQESVQHTCTYWHNLHIQTLTQIGGAGLELKYAFNLKMEPNETSVVRVALY